MNGRFRLTVWDPRLIVSQIVAVVSSFYFTYGFLLLATSFAVGGDLGLRNVFNYETVNLRDRQGFVDVFCYIINAALGSVILCLIVKRTKLCLDFTATTYAFHLLFCWIYSGTFPSTFTWWIFTLIGITIMCVSGEFLCLKYEMEDIPLLGARVSL